MTQNQCICPQCLHETCPQPDAQPPFDEVVHEVNDNFISVKIPKTTAEYQPENVPKKPQNLDFDFNCADDEGEKCMPGCTRVHVIPNARPPPKKPAEEMLSLRSRRRTLPNDDVSTVLEIEFKGPRNYVPLPDPGPPPPIIVPKCRLKRIRKKKKTKK